MSSIGIRSIQIYFKHDCLVKCMCRPVSSVCAMSVTIPVHYTSLESLTEIFNDAINNTRLYGFGLH